MPDAQLSEKHIAAFRRDGYLYLPAFRETDELLALADRLATEAAPPLEYEAETGYPGAPPSIDAPGGRTLRRLRGIYARHSLFQEHARDPRVLSLLHELLAPELLLSQAHHNCLMFKDPRYGSSTDWHQDMRYWRFARPDLISSWLALNPAGPEGGCLYFVPGSHTLEFRADQFDREQQFFRADTVENQALLAQALPVPLAAGDLVLFHSRLLHAATRNTTTAVRKSLIFTYHSADNAPQPGTRSAATPDVSLSE